VNSTPGPGDDRFPMFLGNARAILLREWETKTHVALDLSTGQRKLIDDTKRVWSTAASNGRGVALLRHRDSKSSEDCGDTLRAVGVKPGKLPPQSPNWNARAERFVSSVS
jgi:hypothetical protein